MTEALANTLAGAGCLLVVTSFIGFVKWLWSIHGKLSILVDRVPPLADRVYANEQRLNQHGEIIAGHTEQLRILKHQ